MASTYPSRTIRSKPFNYHHLSQLRSDRQTFYTLVAPIKDHRRAFSGDVKRGRNLFRVTTHRAICRGQIKLGDGKKKKKVSTHENCYFVERFAGKLIDHGMIHDCHRFVVSNDIFDISMPARLSSLYLMIFFFSFWNIYPWIFDLSRSLKLRSTNGRLTYLPWKEVFQKGWLRSRRMRKDLFQVSQFWKILRDWEKEREISGNDYQELERSFGYSGIISEDTKFKWLYKAKKLWRSQS